MQNVDVAIIGGGPAGLSSAIEFAERGLLVSVIESQAPIIDKPCGEGLMPEGVEHLRRLGVLAHLEQRQMSPFLGICFVNEKGERAASNFSKGYGLGCRRINLSQALYARVREFNTINLWPALALGIKKTTHGMFVETERGVLRARLIVGADGLRSSLRRWAALIGESAQVKRYGLRQHFRIKPWSQHIEVHFRAGIEAYVTPCGPEQTNVAFLWTKGRLVIEEISFASMLDLFPDIKTRLAGCEPLSEQMAIGPLEQKSLAPIADGVALVGDASGYLDAITGEGISLALAQAQALSSIAAPALKAKRGVLSREQLQPYAKAHRSIVRSYYRTTKLMLWFAARPRLMSMLIKAGSLSPQAFSLVIEAFRTSGKLRSAKLPALSTIVR